jgi:predicted DNA-binding transcriptional regulator YafY
MSFKHPSTSRQWKLLAILKESKKGITINALVERLKVGERTIRRDLKMLLEQNIPLQELTESHGRKLWLLKEDPFVPATFNFEEAAALYLGHRFLSPLANSFLWESAESGLQKIRRQLGTGCVRLLDHLLEIFHESTTGWSDYSQQSEIISTLILACEDKKETVIRYRSYSAVEEQKYTIHPYALVTQGGTFYVVGFHCNCNEIRIWKLNRIVAAECLSTKFKKPKDFNTDKYRRRGFGVFVFSDEPVQKVRIKVDGLMARYVQEHHWHETQQFETHPDGSVIVQFEVVPNKELTSWILKLGCNAEVLEPESLRREIKAEITKMLRRYK